MQCYGWTIDPSGLMAWLWDRVYTGQGLSKNSQLVSMGNNASDWLVIPENNLLVLSYIYCTPEEGIEAEK